MIEVKERKLISSTPLRELRLNNHLTESPGARAIRTYGGEDIVRMSVSPGDLFFDGVLDYYRTCYNKHRGIVISPEHLWHIVLYEIATVVAGDPEKYRNLFTTSATSTNISIPTGDPQRIDLRVIVEKLKQLVPTDIDTFIPPLTTYTNMSYTTMCAAFCDLVSPYYNYLMFACGFPSITVRGTGGDWINLANAALDIGYLMPDLYDYANRVSNVLQGLIDVEYDELSLMFSSRPRGSGAALFITGWLKDLFINNKPRPFSQFPTVVSKVNYTYGDTGEDFTMFMGIFSGQEKDGVVEPEYGYIIKKND